MIIVPVHVGELDSVIVEQQQLADAATREHLGSDTANTTNTNNGDTVLTDALESGMRTSHVCDLFAYLVIFHDAHALQCHEAATGGAGVRTNSILFKFVPVGV